MTPSITLANWTFTDFVTVSNVKEKIKKRHFVTLTRIVSRQINKPVFVYCTLLTIVVSTYPLQQLFNMATTMFWYIRSSISGVWWISWAAPKTRASRFFTVSTAVWYTRDFMKPHRQKFSGVKSGDRGSQPIGSPRPIHLCPKHRLRWSLDLKCLYRERIFTLGITLT